jgi:hypothetical protein
MSRELPSAIRFEGSATARNLPAVGGEYSGRSGLPLKLARYLDISDLLPGALPSTAGSGWSALDQVSRPSAWLGSLLLKRRAPLTTCAISGLFQHQVRSIRTVVIP